MALLRDDHIHFIGIGGIGVSAVARVALERGHHVSGSDVRRSQLTDSIAEAGARVTIGHAPENLEGADLVVVSTAIPDHNVELRAAHERGMRVLHRSEVLHELARQRTTIGVTGTHGKGTVSSMITWILHEAGWNPGFVIGGLLENFGVNARWGGEAPDGRSWMVLEVDESDGSHQRILTNYLVCNFLEADHLNYYDDLDHIIDAMAECVRDNDGLRMLFVNGDCAGNRTLLERVSKRAASYGLEDDCDLHGTLDGKGQFPIRFAVDRRGDPLGRAELPIPGRYNVTNALGALSVALEIGVPLETALDALGRFKGLENRFSIVRAGGLTIVKDYISHPTGMKRVLESARDLTDGRIFCVWKPYRYTLLNYLQDEYATAFAGAHEVFITTMYAAKEDPIPGIDTQFIVDKIRGTGMNVSLVPDQNNLVDALEGVVREGDKVIFFGGDDFFEMADAWAVRLGTGSPAEAERG